MRRRCFAGMGPTADRSDDDRFRSGARRRGRCKAPPRSTAVATAGRWRLPVCHSFAATAGAALTIEQAFRGALAIPDERSAKVVEASVSWDHATLLKLVSRGSLRCSSGDPPYRRAGDSQGDEPAVGGHQRCPNPVPQRLLRWVAGIYGVRAARWACCLRSPYGVTPRGLLTAPKRSVPAGPILGVADGSGSRHG
jgi:hypothetical protein